MSEEKTKLPAMTIEIASQNLSTVTSKAQMNLQEHISVQQSLLFVVEKAKAADILQGKLNDAETTIKSLEAQVQKLSKKKQNL